MDDPTAMMVPMNAIVHKVIFKVDCSIDAYIKRINKLLENIKILTGRQCRADEFRCSYDHRCIPFTMHCDRRYDCIDGSDETGCREFCLMRSFYGLFSLLLWVPFSSLCRRLKKQFACSIIAPEVGEWHIATAYDTNRTEREFSAGKYCRKNEKSTKVA